MSAISDVSSVHPFVNAFVGGAVCDPWYVIGSESEIAQNLAAIIATARGGVDNFGDVHITSGSHHIGVPTTSHQQPGAQQLHTIKRKRRFEPTTHTVGGARHNKKRSVDVGTLKGVRSQYPTAREFVGLFVDVGELSPFFNPLERHLLREVLLLEASSSSMISTYTKIPCCTACNREQTRVLVRHRVEDFGFPKIQRIWEIIVRSLNEQGNSIGFMAAICVECLPNHGFVGHPYCRFIRHRSTDQLKKEFLALKAYEETRSLDVGGKRTSAKTLVKKMENVSERIQGVANRVTTAGSADAIPANGSEQCASAGDGQDDVQMSLSSHVQNAVRNGSSSAVPGELPPPSSRNFTADEDDLLLKLVDRTYPVPGARIAWAAAIHCAWLRYVDDKTIFNRDPKALQNRFNNNLKKKSAIQRRTQSQPGLSLFSVCVSLLVLIWFCRVEGVSDTQSGDVAAGATSTALARPRELPIGCSDRPVPSATSAGSSVVVAPNSVPTGPCTTADDPFIGTAQKPSYPDIVAASDSLDSAIRGMKFTADEKELFGLVMKHDGKQFHSGASRSVNWSKFCKRYMYRCGERKVVNPTSTLYRRTKEQLKEHHKSRIRYGTS